MKTFAALKEVRGKIHLCGEGCTSVEAWDDAFGPLGLDRSRRAFADGAYVKEVDQFQLARYRRRPLKREVADLTVGQN